MDQIILHTGNYSKIPRNTKILGSIIFTEQEMSDIGYQLGCDDYAVSTEVFTNSEHVFNGLRLAILDGKMPFDGVTIVNHYGSDEHSIYLRFDKFANVVGTDSYHIFNQSIDDVSKILLKQSNKRKLDKMI
jgi:hypothetical protein